MKKSPVLFLVVLFLACQPIFAQEKELSKEFKKQTVEQLSKLMIDQYVFPDVAKKTAAHLEKQLNTGQYDKINDLEEFGEALTEAVQSINHDKHMRIRPVPERKEPPNTPERMIEDRIANMLSSRRSMGGFAEAKKLDGNIGYLDLRGFAHLDYGVPVADHYMGLLGTSDAIIIDLRKNGGGSPAMVQYLCSYFFDEKIHLNSLYWREGEQTEEFWTLDKIGGKKIPDVPLFVLTSSYTFSGAEEFSYNMQTRKRATLVGETTGGGANPGDGFPINEKLMVFIPTGKAINPVTKTNWEGVGVVPEVKVPAEEALDKALELANIAAENYRHQLEGRYQKLFANLHNNINSCGENCDNQAMVGSLKACVEEGLLGEGQINGMGYQYLLEMKEPKKAEALLRANTVLFPESANVHDSYGEALAMNGKMHEALKSYEKAVAVAKKNDDPNLGLFKENLEMVKKKTSGKP